MHRMWAVGRIEEVKSGKEEREDGGEEGRGGGEK